MPEASDPLKLDQIKWRRYMMAKNGGMPKPDYRPRNFAWVMRKEIGIFFVSIAFGLMLPSIFRRNR